MQPDYPPLRTLIGGPCRAQGHCVPYWRLGVSADDSKNPPDEGKDPLDSPSPMDRDAADWPGIADDWDPLADDGDLNLGDLIEDEDGVQPLDAAIGSDLRSAIGRALESLAPREERVLRMRFGIGIENDHTLEEVGQQFSVTRERIRQIEAKALRKLKLPSRARPLRTFLDP